METIKKRIANALKNSLKKMGGVAPLAIESLLESPPDSTLGDLAFPCFSLAKELRKSPAQVADELACALPKAADVDRVSAAGPYVNFFLNARALAALANSKTPKKKKTKGTIVIEYVSPNTNKPLHLGHVRNAVLGDSVARILEATGNTVVKTCLVNDRGIHICKSMVAYLEEGKKLEVRGKRLPTPKSEDTKGDHFVGNHYVLFERKLKDDPSLMESAQECLKRWEAGDRRTRTLWKKMNTWVLAGMKETYRRLGIDFDKTYFESQIYDKGKDLILKNLNKGVVVRDETGAVYADLSTWNLPNKILLRKDGTCLYITQDVYLAVQKAKDFKARSSIYVIGSEQDLYLKQLFAVLDLFKFVWAKNLRHLSYGMVNLPEGKMKSREGTVVDADDLLDELETLARVEIQKRDAALSQKEASRRAKTIALSALKFYMVDVSPKSEMTFDPKQSIAFQGHTGPYLLYTVARLESILRKAKKSRAPVRGAAYDWLAEKQLLLSLLQFDDITRRAAAELNPSVISHYLFDLAQKINDYYHTTPILSAPESIRQSRILLIARLSGTLKQGLDLLGIKTLEKM
ncbi:MAG: arginine--tRNA ligase [Patescibacteria group bacterium]